MEYIDLKKSCTPHVSKANEEIYSILQMKDGKTGKNIHKEYKVYVDINATNSKKICDL